MSKRVKLSIDPYKFQYNTCFAFLCVVYRVPQMRKCLNKDILKKICGLVEIDLSEKMEIDNHMYYLEHFGEFIFWHHPEELAKRPCHVCLRPTTDWKIMTCTKHKYNLKCRCTEYHHSISIECVSGRLNISTDSSDNHIRAYLE